MCQSANICLLIRHLRQLDKPWDIDVLELAGVLERIGCLHRRLGGRVLTSENGGLSLGAVSCALLLVLAVTAAEPNALGRSPLEKVTAIYSGRFTSAESDDILVLQNVGDVELSRTSGQGAARLALRRLALIRRAVAGLRVAWQGETFASSTAEQLGLAGQAWCSGDMDGDGLQELLLLGDGYCRVISFLGDSAKVDTAGFDGTAVEAATACDLNDDGVLDVVTLERPGFASSEARLCRAYQFAGNVLVPHQAYEVGIDWGSDTRIALLGAARLDDYAGVLPVIAGIRSEVKPSVYAVLYEPDSSRTLFTTNPFPWQEWFSKTRVLPAGELSLFNVGDTLVGYGYFVPGSRRSGPSMSFVALQDGEWRLLSLTDAASHIAGPVCRYDKDGISGWLELRDELFYFYPGEVFNWR